jgi:hypothetical protein
MQAADHATDAALPATLPADAKGYTKHMHMHLNYGEAGGAATYSIRGPGGITMPISYQYDTRKKGAAPTGFFIDGVDQVFKRWADLAAYWPTYFAERAQ